MDDGKKIAKAILDSTKPQKKRQDRVRYSQRIADFICDKIATGKTLKKAIELAGPLAPSPILFWRWMEKYPELAVKYDRARLMAADLNADTLLELADEVLVGNNYKKASAYKASAEIRRWLSEVRDPTKFGKKLQIETPEKTLDPEKMRAEIERLQKALGIVAAHGPAALPHPALPGIPDQAPDAEIVEVRDVTPPKD